MTLSALPAEQDAKAQVPEVWPDAPAEASPVAAGPVATEHLRIELRGGEGLSRQTAQAICQNFGSRLQQHRGPFGLGLFSSVACWQQGSLVQGEVADQAGPWHLLVEVLPGQLRLTMHYQAPGLESAAVGEPIIAAALQLQATPSTAEFLGHDALMASALAAALLDALPVAAYGTPPDAAKSSAEDLALSGFAPQQMVQMQLALVQPGHLWRATPAATGEPSFRQRREGPGHRVAALMQLAEERQSHLSAATALAMSETTGFSLRKTPDRGGSDLAQAATEPFTKGFIGTRFGHELVNPKGAVLPPTNLYGLLAEFRGGWAKGLRLYYDVVPRDASSPYYVAWQRAVLGWGFGYSPDCPQAIGRCMLEVAPKVGVWSVDGRLPVAANSGQIVVSHYTARRELSLGYEISADVERGAYLWRVWHARDSSLGALSKALDSQVSSVRYGVDALIKLPASDLIAAGTSIGVLLFISQDNLSLSGNQTPDATSGVASSDLKQHLNLGLSTTYGGIGATMAW